MLYNTARDGKLMVLPLGGVRPLQTTPEDGNELVKRDDLGTHLNIQYLGPALVEPKPRELNFFKNILNVLFGAFQEEKESYIDEYNTACDKYLLKTDFGFRRFLIAGKKNVRVELFFLALGFNLKKRWMKQKKSREKTHYSEKKAA